MSVNIRGSHYDLEEEARIRGTDDTAQPDWTEIMIGEDDTIRRDIFVSNRLKVTSNGALQGTRVQEQGTGFSLIIPPNATKAQAMRYLDHLKFELEKFWGGIAINPDFWELVYRVRQSEPPDAPENDADCNTWSKVRVDRVLRAIMQAAGIMFLKMPRDVQRLYLADGRDEDLVRDTLLFAQTAVKEAQAVSRGAREMEMQTK